MIIIIERHIVLGNREVVIKVQLEANEHDYLEKIKLVMAAINEHPGNNPPSSS